MEWKHDELYCAVNRLSDISVKEPGRKIMSSEINPEAAQPTTTQAFEQSDRNPSVTYFGGTDAEGGQFPTPAPGESRVTQPGAAPSTNAGLQNYGTGSSADSVENEAERES